MNDMKSSVLPPHVGLGSFAFRYAVGFPGFFPETPMGPDEFLRSAHALGYRRVQICENLRLPFRSPGELERLNRLSGELGIALEIGFKKVDEDSLVRYMEIARRMGVRFIRAVIHDKDSLTREVRGTIMQQTSKLLKNWAGRLEDAGVRLGLENHFDLFTDELVTIVGEVGSPAIGLVFDTTNSLGFLEPPEITLNKMSGRIFSMHLKDYTIRKAEAGYEIVGTVLGEGLLNAEKILSDLVGSDPEASVILEMAVRRNPDRQVKAVVEWEKEEIRKSTVVLASIVGNATRAAACSPQYHDRRTRYV